MNETQRRNYVRLERLPKLADGTPNIRDALMYELGPLAMAQQSTGKPVHVAVPMSGGIDSQTMLFTALELDLQVTGYTFALEGIESRDLKYARATCEAFSVPHKTVWLSNNPKVFIDFVKWFLPIYGNLTTAKSSVTCLWAALTLLEYIHQDGPRHTLWGFDADAYFAMSRGASQFCRVNDVPLETLYHLNFRHPTEQPLVIKAESAVRNMTAWFPYGTTTMLARMLGQKYKFNDVNKPKEKWWIRREFQDYLEHAKYANHQNYQLGDTGIGKHAETTILESHLNSKGYKDAGAVLAYAFNNQEVLDGIDATKSRLFKKRKF